MKLKPSIEELDIKLEGFNFEEVFEKTLKQVKSSYFDSPELFISTFVANSEHLQALGDSNGWEDVELVIKAVIDEIKKKQLKGDTEKGLALMVIQTLGKKYEKPKEKEKEKKETVSKVKEQTFKYPLEEGFMGTEIQYDKKTILSKESFEAKIKEVHGKDASCIFEYTDTEAIAKVGPLKKDTTEKEDQKLFTVETNEEVDPDDEDAEPTFVIRKPDGELLEDESGDNDGEPQVFDTEEEAEQLAKQLNLSILEQLNKDAKPKEQEKPKIEKKTKKVKETKSETVVEEPVTDETLIETEKEVDVPVVETKEEPKEKEETKDQKQPKVEKKKEEPKVEKKVEVSDDFDW